MEIDVSKIIKIPSDIEIPVHGSPIPTLRPLCTEFPQNAIILDKTEAIKIITEISEDLNEQEHPTEQIPQYVADLLAVFDPLNTEECSNDLFKDREIEVIKDIEEIKKFLSELLIRFDTSPKNYTKEDYQYLLTVLYKSLLFVYQQNLDKLAPIAYSGDVQDLNQLEYIILDCGSSSEDV